MMGGGGEGGFATRTPELMLSDADPRRRHDGGRLPRARTASRAAWPACWRRREALDEEGLSTFIYTGHYAVPVQTLTGSIERDLLLIDKVIGVGEVALSDHRSTQPTFDEFARLAAEARRGGILSGKAGVVNVHMGDGRRGLVAAAPASSTETEIPVTQFLPTHINRNPTLFEEGIAYAKAGGLVDFTTSTVPAFLDEGEVKCSAGLRRMLDAGVDAANITFTSDGQGSLPGLRRARAAAAPRDRPRHQPVRRGARRGAQRGRAARDGAAGRSRRTPRAS